MVCTVCSTANPDNATKCSKCGAAFRSAAEEQPTAFMAPTRTGVETSALTGWTVPASTGAAAAAAMAALAPGSIVGGRYEIVTLLGEGGMGAVYKAMDHELDRELALKVIKPQFARQADVLQRFKRELVLARQITHRNVIRIFDLGLSEGMRFITMEFVEGRELSSLVEERGKLPPDEAIGYVEQICEGLRVAHAEGVVHRDLKPSNVMIDAQGRAVIMDFGIARALDTATLTNTGALVGTPVYMSPEQAKGDPLDARSDLFTLGIIFYELLTGTVPFKADNLMTMLLKRCQEDARPAIEADPSIPPRLNEIVMKLLAREPDKRYQTAQALLDDLRAYRTPPVFAAPPPRRFQAWKAVVAGLCMGAAAVFGYWKLRPSGPPPVPKEVKVLVADFDNTTSESVFDGALEPVIATGLEGASFVSMYNRAAAHTIAESMRPGAAKLDEKLARLVAKREGINVVLTGLVARRGDGYRVTVNAIDGASGETIVTRDSPSAKKDAILKETARLIPALRSALGDVTPENQQMAAGETFTSSSLDAVREYGTAQQLQLARKYDEAIAHYQAALKADPQLGRAYAGIASSSYNQGRLADAEKNYKLAISLIDRMSEREKLRTLGGYALMVRDYPQAVRQFNSLVREYPYDTAGTANLAFAYCVERDMPKAVELGRKAVDLYRGNIGQRLNLIMFLVYNGETAAALAEARTIQDQKKAYVLTALADVLDGHVDEAAKALDALQKTGPRGVSMALTGSADLALYQGRFSDAASMLQKLPEEDARDPRSDLAVGKALIRAEALAAKGAAADAARAADAVLALSDQDAALVIAAQVLTRAHQEEAAQRLAQKLAERVAPEPRAWAKVVSAELLLARGKAPDAIEELNQAQKLTDTWLGHFDLGRAYIEAGSFPQGVSEIDLCLKRRGEAASVFLVDDLPTIRYLPAVYYYAGRAQEGVGSPRAAESYKTFLAIKEKSENDPLVTDARKRLAALAGK